MAGSMSGASPPDRGSAAAFADARALAVGCVPRPGLQRCPVHASMFGPIERLGRSGSADELQAGFPVSPISTILSTGPPRGPTGIAENRDEEMIQARLRAFSLTNKFRERNGAGLSSNNKARKEASGDANQGRRKKRCSDRTQAGSGKSNFHASHSAVAAR